MKLIIEEYDENYYNLINKYKIRDKYFVYDGCHKIYIIEDEDDIKSVKQLWGENEKFYDIKELPTVWENSCSLRFIHNWKLTKTYVAQFNNAVFKIE